MKLGFIGLGKMGQQMVVRLVKAGNEVVVTDIHAEARAEAAHSGATAVDDRESLVAALGEAPVVWLMIPAGAVDGELDALLALLPHGSIVIDGGNSDFRDTLKRAKRATAKGVELVDVGTSGGILGLAHGFSMMVGGDATAVERVTPAIVALAQDKGWRHFGPVGSGHFIKMVHNGIEYGVMEAYAEGYRILNEGHDFGGFDLAAIASVWQHGSIINSELNELVSSILATNPTLEGIDGYVAESGEARWTLEVAKERGLEAPVIQASLEVRKASEQGNVNFATKLLAAMRNAFGGHHLNK